MTTTDAALVESVEREIVELAESARKLHDSGNGRLVVIAQLEILCIKVTQR